MAEHAPTRHGAVIGRFGRVAVDTMSDRDALMQAGRDLNRMYEGRVSADYDIAERTSVDVAHECLVKARRLLATCASAFGDRLDNSRYR